MKQTNNNDRSQIIQAAYHPNTGVKPWDRLKPLYDVLQRRNRLIELACLRVMWRMRGDWLNVMLVQIHRNMGTETAGVQYLIMAIQNEFKKVA